VKATSGEPFSGKNSSQQRNLREFLNFLRAFHPPHFNKVSIGKGLQFFVDIYTEINRALLLA
jgi:hypothetical protein